MATPNTSPTSPTSPDRLVLLNIDHHSHMLTISPDGSDMRALIVDVGSGPPDGVGIDSQRGHIFWTYMGTSHDGEDYLANDGSIERIDIDGGNRVVIIAEGVTFTPKQLQVDSARELIYWCDREGMRVMRAGMDGSQVTVLVQTGHTDEDRQDRRRHCVGVAIDPQAGYLYWTQKGKPNGNEGRILRAGLELPPGADPANRPDVEVLFDNLPEPIDLEWEPNRHYLYWTDRGDPPAGNTLNRALIKPGEPMIREIILTGLNEGIGLALDHANKRAFVSDLGGFVQVISLDHPDNGATIFSGHGPLTGIAYLRG
jgi:hypothetical protein